ncbi:MAG: hypothetical protein Q7S61_04835 [bacterium]|nr:hypothetical protein [bacterium]
MTGELFGPSPWGDFDEYAEDWKNVLHQSYTELRQLDIQGLPGTQPFQAVMENIIDTLEKTKLTSAHHFGQAWDFNGYLQSLKDFVLTCGLNEETVGLVIREMLERSQLWTNQSIKALVIDNLHTRSGVESHDTYYLRLKLFEDMLLSNITLETRRSVSFIRFLADQTEELYGKRSVDDYKVNSIHKIGIQRSIIPMTPSQWTVFQKEPLYKEVAMLDTANWFLSHQQSSREEVAMKQTMAKTSLAHYLVMPLYQQLDRDPIPLISQRVSSFLALCK